MGFCGVQDFIGSRDCGDKDTAYNWVGLKGDIAESRVRQVRRMQRKAGRGAAGE